MIKKGKNSRKFLRLFLPFLYVILNLAGKKNCIIMKENDKQMNKEQPEDSENE